MNNRRLRILVNNFCNYNCIFCHNEGQNKKPFRKIKYTPENLIRILDSLQNRNYCIEKAIFTGGEPTLVEELPLFIKILKDRYPVAIISNGYKLTSEFQKIFIDNGLQEVFFSLHTLNPKAYTYITKTSLDAFDRVTKNIKDGRNLSIKRYINVVLLKNINDTISSSLRLLQFAEEYQIEGVQFIELDVSLNKSSFNHLKSLVSYLEEKLIRNNIISGLKSKTDRKKIYNSVHDKTSVIFSKCSFLNKTITDIDIIIDTNGTIALDGLQ